MANAGELKVKCIPLGMLSTNCFLIWREGMSDAVVIDPGGSVDKVLDVAEENGLSIKYVINTHGHDDHICGNRDIRTKTGCKIYIGELDADKLTSSKDKFRLLARMGGGHDLQADYVLNDGDVLNDYGLNIKVVHTPGHSVGSISLVLDDDKVVFTGDTLFKCGVGRTDFEDGNEEALWNSIFSRIFALDDDYIIYPGHGESSTIGTERNRYRSY